jgi:predicted RNase H-like nuclease (RuvC/YqgF family)
MSHKKTIDAADITALRNEYGRLDAVPLELRNLAVTTSRLQTFEGVMRIVAASGSNLKVLRIETSKVHTVVNSLLAESREAGRLVEAEVDDPAENAARLERLETTLREQLKQRESVRQAALRNHKLWDKYDAMSEEIMALEQQAKTLRLRVESNGDGRATEEIL